ncbi:MAG: OmpA family protein [Saprospiraceae bacterium]|nr:OmpA family protein [Saprospiraceae bacterium]MCF8249633.1 OmpA family protein [Saprospiraceae bacterium]MCF8280443.1 OmpA family protein [Bacteroidales bacterium]MCF8310465.1 OmpA family protein [Saprospiraceae bacterium]MCF8439843.1 OmpA family protein [Saprospiraceae bacterium]
MKSLYAFFLFAIFALAACNYTQKVKDGNFAVDRKQYAVAVDLLKKEHQKAKSRVEKGKIAFQLGESYRMLNKPASASDWYKKAFDDGYGTDALREYAYSLKQQEQYDEAMKQFKELGIEIGSPYEYKREIAACQVAKGWKEEKSKAYAATILPFSSPGADYAPAIFQPGKIVFTSDRQAATGDDTYKWTGNEFSDLFTADLQSNDVQPFDNQLNTPNNEGTATFNKANTELYFTRCYGDKKEDNFCKIISSKWDGSKWSDPVALPFQQNGINYGHPALSADGSTLYFSSNSKDGWGGYDLWSSERGRDEKWTEPKLMPRTVNTIGNEKFPWLDGDTLYFASDFHPGMGGLDIFKTYKSAGGAWAPVQNLKPPLNSGSDDFAYVIDYQAKKGLDVLQVGYFSSNRPDGNGNDDLYRFERRIPPPEPVKPVAEYKLKLEGYVLEKIYAEADNPDTKVLGRKPLNGAMVEVKFGKEVKNFTVAEDGFFSMDLTENTDYQFIATKNGYLTGETFFSTKGIGKDPNNPVQTFEVEVVLDKIFLNKEIVLEDIYYDFDKWDIRPDAQPTLNALARNLELNPKIRIQLSSHTDCRGNDGYNAELSQRRAQSAVDYLVSRGISVERLSAKGYGESLPKATCACARCTEEEHQLNRRTSFTVLEGL